MRERTSVAGALMRSEMYRSSRRDVEGRPAAAARNRSPARGAGGGGPGAGPTCSRAVSVSLWVASTPAVLDILKRTKTDTRIPALLPKGTIVAHKTGTIRGVRCDAGVVYAPRGPYAVAILSKGVGNDLRVDVALAEISAAIYETMTSPAFASS